MERARKMRDFTSCRAFSRPRRTGGPRTCSRDGHGCRQGAKAKLDWVVAPADATPLVTRQVLRPRACCCAKRVLDTCASFRLLVSSWRSRKSPTYPPISLGTGLPLPINAPRANLSTQLRPPTWPRHRFSNRKCGEQVLIPKPRFLKFQDNVVGNLALRKPLI